MIPGLESAPESDFGSFFTSDHDDSGSGFFSLESTPFPGIGSTASSIESITISRITWHFLI